MKGITGILAAYSTNFKSRQKWMAVIPLTSSEPELEYGSGDDREKAKRKLGTHNKYEIKAVAWCPHLSNHQFLASTVSMDASCSEILLYVV